MKGFWRTLMMPATILLLARAMRLMASALTDGGESPAVAQTPPTPRLRIGARRARVLRGGRPGACRRPFTMATVLPAPR
jgi:hypothetical protein